MVTNKLQAGHRSPAGLQAAVLASLRHLAAMGTGIAQLLSIASTAVPAPNSAGAASQQPPAAVHMTEQAVLQALDTLLQDTQSPDLPEAASLASIVSCLADTAGSSSDAAAPTAAEEGWEGAEAGWESAEDIADGVEVSESDSAGLAQLVQRLRDTVWQHLQAALLYDGDVQPVAKQAVVQTLALLVPAQGLSR